MSCNTARKQLCSALGARPHVAANLGGGDAATASQVLEDVYDLVCARNREAAIDPAAARADLLLLKGMARKHKLTIPRHDKADPNPAQVRGYLALLDAAVKADAADLLPREVVEVARSRGVTPSPVTFAPMCPDELQEVLGAGFQWFVDDSFLSDYTVHLARDSRGTVVGYAAFDVTGSGKRQTARLPYIESHHPGTGATLLNDLKARYARIAAEYVQWPAVDWFHAHGFVEDGNGEGDEGYDAGTFIWRRPKAQPKES